MKRKKTEEEKKLKSKSEVLNSFFNKNFWRHFSEKRSSLNSYLVKINKINKMSQNSKNSIFNVVNVIVKDDNDKEEIFKMFKNNKNKILL